MSKQKGIKKNGQGRWWHLWDSLSFGELALFLFLVVSTIAWSTTTFITRYYTIEIRRVCIVIFLGFLLAHLRGWSTFKKPVRRSLLVLGFIFLYGALLAYFNGNTVWTGGEDGSFLHSPIFTDLCLLSASVLVLASQSELDIGVRTCSLYVVFAVGVLMFTIALGGMVLEVPPRFIFEAESFDSDGGLDLANRAYSQGASKFFGLAAAMATYLACFQRNMNERIAFSFIALGMLSCSIIGGGRGDVVAAVLVVIICIVVRFPRIAVAAIPVLLIGAMFYSGWGEKLYSELVIVDRMLNLRHSFGLRDVLAQQSLELLISDTQCLFIGGGFGYFQDYYGYDYGKYPHNFVLEMLVTFGAPMTALLGGLAVRGIWLRWKSGTLSGIVCVFYGYFFLISLKSGSFTGSWFVVAGMIVMITENFGSFSSIERRRKRAMRRRRFGRRRSPGRRSLRQPA